MTNDSRLTIKTFMILITVSSTVAFLILVGVLNMIGFDSIAILRITFVWFPICIFSVLYGFYKGIVNHYGFKVP